jgi:hypothetical protein
MPTGYALMGGQPINIAFHPAPFFPDAVGSNHDGRRDGFAEALNTYDPIATNAGIFFDVSMTSASDRRDLRTIAQKNSRFLFRPQFRPVRLESFGST